MKAARFFLFTNQWETSCPARWWPNPSYWKRSSIGPEAREQLKANRWPTDTVIRTAHGGWRATLTVICQETHSFTLHWIPTSYAFAFDSSVALAAWSRRIGEFLPDHLLESNDPKQGTI